MNPKGSVPFIVYKNEVLSESTAILRFICTINDSLGKYYPTDPLQRFKVDAALDYCSGVFRPYINK